MDTDYTDLELLTAIGNVINRVDLKAQVEAEVKAATLRAVGEALEHRSLPLEQKVVVSTTEIEALLAGQMPAGWEKE